MHILGLDTSTLAVGAVLTEDSLLKASYFLDNRLSHSRKLLPVVDLLLCESNLQLRDIDLFCVAAGPGSFTGLRIGLSIIKGLSLATGKPLVGVPTLPAMASAFEHAGVQICPIIDARKKEIYCALFRDENGSMTRLTDDMVLKPERLCELIKEPTIFIGDGLQAYGDLIRDRLGSKAIISEHLYSLPIAEQVARLGSDLFRRGPVAEEINVFYVRDSDARLKFENPNTGTKPKIKMTV
jgi:tRNA threonylcarbamoyladenosine biosynthesis protein TsaB